MSVFYMPDIHIKYFVLLIFNSIFAHKHTKNRHKNE